MRRARVNTKLFCLVVMSQCLVQLRWKCEDCCAFHSQNRGPGCSVGARKVVGISTLKQVSKFKFWAIFQVSFDFSLGCESAVHDLAGSLG